MFCNKCGKQLKDSDKFCVGCGTPVSRDENITPQNNSKKLVIIIVAIVASLMVIAGIITAVVLLNRDKDDNKNTKKNKETEIATDTVTETDKITEDDTEKETEKVTETETVTETEIETETEPEIDSIVSDDGKTLNIWVWNEGLIDKIAEHYPGYVPYDKSDLSKGGYIGDVEVKYTMIPASSFFEEDYYDCLWKTLQYNGEAQQYASADEKIDIFMLEGYYLSPYVNSNYTLDLNDIGINVDTDFANQYQYAKDYITDSNGSMKGAAIDLTPGALIYRADFAKEVLGTSDPDEVQKAVADWDSYKNTAAKMKKHGYYMTATLEDTFKVFDCNRSSKWYENSDVNIDSSIKDWVDISDYMIDNKYVLSTEAMWYDDWASGHWQEFGEVFCYFGPAWLVDYSMSCDEDGSVGQAGNWRVAPGPQGFFWGAEYLCVANGTDNKSLVADIIKVLTADEDVMYDMMKDGCSDFVNNSEVIKKLYFDKSLCNPYLNNQNPLKYFDINAKKIRYPNWSENEELCKETFLEVMKDYFDRKLDYDEAIDFFESRMSYRLN